ncbi:hypothetical protein ARHIZOSPH14_08190 [Agromyces rhizosphaerae]|uniref:DUF805 domain-containing protein n=1 Tax=Agromyces rhizosphaerae TaxID=88374 RepID=A0A9W6CUD5_9MICO|nr:DUF805 domain-containing protein [Agromyces rhizosphaerae]GLI26577.1 hypothetical protein ARHIZOSPH14_08190 [Agromyces rhizosphaerae]
MSFGESIQTVFRKYAEFRGRATRPEYWWWVLFLVLVSAGLNVLNVIRLDDGVLLGSILGGIWGLAVLLPNLAVTVRRLRDAGYGWGNLFWLLLPVAGFIVLIVMTAQPTKAPVTAPPAGGAAPGTPPPAPAT